MTQNTGDWHFQDSAWERKKAEASMLPWIKTISVHLNHLSEFIMIKSRIMFAPHLQFDCRTDGKDLQKH